MLAETVEWSQLDNRKLGRAIMHIEIIPIASGVHLCSSHPHKITLAHA